MTQESRFVLNFEPNPLMNYGTNGAKTSYAVLYGHRPLRKYRVFRDCGQICITIMCGSCEVTEK
jgi:hypothetical protein